MAVGRGGQDAHQLVEVAVVGLDAAVERRAERERARGVELEACATHGAWDQAAHLVANARWGVAPCVTLVEAVLLERAVESVERAGGGRRVAAEHRRLREGARRLARHRDVGEQHELLDLCHARCMGSAVHLVEGARCGSGPCAANSSTIELASLCWYMPTSVGSDVSESSTKRTCHTCMYASRSICSRCRCIGRLRV